MAHVATRFSTLGYRIFTVLSLAQVGVWEHIHNTLHVRVREQEGKKLDLRRAFSTAKALGPLSKAAHVATMPARKSMDGSDTWWLIPSVC